MKRTPLRRKTRLQAKAPLRRSGRVKPANPARKRRAFARHFGSSERVAWVNAHACLCGGKHPACSGRTVNAHVRSRAAGGTWRDIVPLSWVCHVWQGDHGGAAWEREAGLEAGAARACADWMATTGPQS